MRRTGMHHIGAVARKLGIPLQDIRSYAEVGLVTPSGRAAGGFDLYTDADVARLRLVRQLAALQLTHRELANILGATRRLLAFETVDLVDAESTLAREAEAAQRAGSGSLSPEELRRLTSGECFAEDLERLENDDLTGAEWGRILDRLMRYAAAIDERCRQLDQQLHEAERTATDLRQVIRRHSRAIEVHG